MKSTSPQIRKLTIDRFRGIEHLEWWPDPGVNVILGGGDVGKSTILDAISLILHPSNTLTISESDYWRRSVENDFCIEAVMSIPENRGIHQQKTNAWPWVWNGKEAILPNTDGEDSADEIVPVFRLRVRGTPDFDVSFEIYQPNDDCTHLSVAVRRAIGLVRLSSDDRNDRDLRLVQGSALERLLSDRTLRSRLGKLLGKSDVQGELSAEAKGKLTELKGAFSEKSLPEELSLGLSGSQNFSLNSLIGLTATKQGVELPLAVWGAGTRRLAALAIAAMHHGDDPITVVDEVERGLEPYRQRSLIAELEKGSSQVFLTTHSVSALRAMQSASLWYLDSTGTIGKLPKKAAVHEKRDPETFLARFAVIAEGATEVGFVTALLRRALGNDLLSHGIWVTDGCGNDSTLDLLDGLTQCGFHCAGFADEEGTSNDRWEAVKRSMGDRLFRWQSGCIEENVINLTAENDLERLIEDPADELTGERMRSLAVRVNLQEKDLPSIVASTKNLKLLIAEAARGIVPPEKSTADKSEKKTYQKHAQVWFKSVKGGEELAEKVFSLGIWPKIRQEMLPFLNSIRTGLSLPPLVDLP